MPKVSIILTSFNHEKYICEAIDSALNQTFTDFELIILDDGSSDNSLNLIKSYPDPRIRIHSSAVNIGGIAMVNKAIAEMTTGSYVAMHHSDDAWEPDKLARQVAYLDAHSEIGAVFTWATIIDEHGIASVGDWFDQIDTNRWRLLNQLFVEQNHLCHPSVLIRMRCYQEIGVYRYGLAQTADAEMWSRLLIRFPIHVIQEKLTRHRKLSDKSNASGDRIDTKVRANNEWNVLRKNYLSISSFEEIVAIFPNLERFRNPEGFDTKFLLAMASLYECEKRSAWQLGISCLFDMINDVTHYEKVRKLYSFTDLEFIRLTAKFDVYRVECDKRVVECESRINDLLSSRSWRLTRPLRFIERLIHSP